MQWYGHSSADKQALGLLPTVGFVTWFNPALSLHALTCGGQKVAERGVSEVVCDALGPATVHKLLPEVHGELHYNKHLYWQKKKFEMHTWEESSNSSWKIGVMEFQTFFYRAHLVVTVSMSFLQYPQSKHLISISYIFLLFKHNTKANKIKTWV